MKKTLKLIGNFLGRMVGTTGCIALVSGATYGLCKVLSKIAGKVVDYIDVAFNYLKDNWIAAVIGVVVLTLGSMLFEGAVVKCIEVHRAKKIARAAAKNKANP